MSGTVSHPLLCAVLFLETNLRILFWVFAAASTKYKKPSQQTHASCVHAANRRLPLTLQYWGHSWTLAKHRPDYHSKSNSRCWVNVRESITQCCTKEKSNDQGKGTKQMYLIRHYSKFMKSPKSFCLPTSVPTLIESQFNNLVIKTNISHPQQT